MNQALFDDVISWMDGELFDDATPQDVREKAAWFASGDDSLFIVCWWDLCNAGYTVHSGGVAQLTDLLWEKMNAAWDEGFSMLVLRKAGDIVEEIDESRMKTKLVVEIV